MATEEITLKHSPLNRSLSFSGSRVCVEQSFQNHKGETLIRQYSCEQIYDPTNKESIHQIKQSYVVHGPKDLFLPPFKKPNTKKLTTNDTLSTKSNTIFNTNVDQFSAMSHASNFNFSKKCPEQKGFEESLVYNKNRYQEIDDESTPMEVDTSLDGTVMADVHTPNSRLNSDSGDISEHKNKVSKLIISPNAPKIESNTSVMNGQMIKSTVIKYMKVSAMFLIPIACAIILMHTDFFPNDDLNSENFNAENITDALQDLLYGQDEVLANLKVNFANVDDNQIIVFTGGIGVGKTYAANIIANNFPWGDNIVKIVTPQYKNIYQETKFIRDLSKYGYNLIIIDSLEFKDRKSVIPFVNKIFYSKKKAIILLIFTIPEYTVNMAQDQEVDVVSGSYEISAELTIAKLNHKIIIFNKLTDDVVRRCIRYALAKKGLIINQFNIDYILQNVNYEYSGCKGVHSKVALLQ